MLIAVFNTLYFEYIYKVHYIIHYIRFVEKTNKLEK